MSDIMTPVPFSRLIDWILTEQKLHKSIFGVKKIRKESNSQPVEFAGQKLENALGVAAGPHTQLAQNIVACYAGGARFIETKTVQRLYGEDLGLPRPCIRAVDEAYNVEWSSEYSPRMAAEEYIKAWFACHVICREYGLGDPNAFQFNMSVGYDLAGIQTKAVDDFLNTLTDASEDPFFLECRDWLLENVDRFENVTKEDILAVPGRVCNTCTLSTMHGCPADEIEKIARYLLVEKKLNTMIKMNPTLLGYDYCDSMMKALDYGYITFDPHSFEADLQFKDAVPMVTRLKEDAKRIGGFFGVKLSNTMEVKICDDELPGKAMYMSGKTLYPLTISLAKKMSEAFGGDLTVSYCGGADADNIAAIYDTGMYPITVCTTILKTPGYDKLDRLATAMEAVTPKPVAHLSTEGLAKIVDGLVDTKTNHKSAQAIKQHESKRGHALIRQRDKVECRVLCQSCVRVCPNRANTVIETASGKRILHLDFACNECGNCQFFCVEPCTPYRDRMTFFASEEAFEDSENTGYVAVDGGYRYRLYGTVGKGTIEEMPGEIREAIEAQRKEQPWLN